MRRTFAISLVLIATSLVAVSAQAERQSRLVLSPSSFKVLFGHRLTLSGMLAGARSGRLVSIEAWAYGKSAPVKIATVSTHANGQFSLRVEPRIQTKYEAISSGASDAVTVGVTPSVSLRELGNGHIWTRVKAGTSFDRRIVKLQALQAGTWRTVAQKRLSAASIAVFSMGLPTGPVRIAMSVNQAGAGYLAALSHALGYRAYAVTIALRSARVLYGHTLTLSGKLLNGRAGQTVSIEAWPYGSSAPHEIASVRSAARGAWRFGVAPKIQTSYFARWAAAHITSGRVVVGVEPLVTVRERADGRLWTRVTAGRSFAGRKVKLQSMAASGAWITVAQRRLDRKSETVFSPPLASSSPIRIAMSVNQAGAGLLGAASHELVYHTV